MKLTELLEQMIDLKASDIFVVAGLPLTYKISGRQVRTSSDILKPANTSSVVEAVYEIAGRDFDAFMRNGNRDEDFSFAIPGIGRFRANIFRQRGSISAVIRVIPFGLPDPQELHIPEDVLRLSRLTKGLALVTGPAGSGKSTTLACIIDRMNHEDAHHIITLEDPIEYVHQHKKCIVTQREVPTDIATYAEGLKSAMRESPNVILLGEMRDAETIGIAITAAEMAQLIFSTLHTNSAAGTIDRIIDAFPVEQRRQIRIQLSLVLQAVVSQQLVPAIDGTVLPVFEIMKANAAIRNLIREEKTYQIDSIIAASGKDGMRTMDQSLFNLVKDKKITADTALRYAIHPEALERRMETEGVS